MKNGTFYVICWVYPQEVLRALCVCLSMASSLSIYHPFPSKLTANSKHLSSSFLASPSSGLSSKFNFPLRFFSNGQSSSLISPTPRRLSVVSMAPPKAKPGGKAKKGKFLFSHKPLIFFYIVLDWALVFSNLFLGVAVIGVIKLALEAGKATPAPPVGPALGSKGVNIMAFCKDYNAKTADKAGYVIPVEITVYDVGLFFLSLLLYVNDLPCFPLGISWLFNLEQDKSFTFVLKTPPASVLLLKAAGISLFYCLMFLLAVPFSYLMCLSAHMSIQ